MKKELCLTLVEYDPIWEDIEINLSYLSRLLEKSIPTDLIILPEMFPTGFTMNPNRISRELIQKNLKWMEDISIKLQTAIAGSLIIKENGYYYNRFICMDQGKVIAHYDKRHLFNYSGEDLSYTAGSKKVIFEYKGWKICPTICFDLRFPVWIRNTENYDLLINVANWPESRIEVWDTLLRARAIENQTYVCGVNRTGIDGNNQVYNGQSCAYSPLGKKLETKPIYKFIYSAELSLIEIEKTRNEYPFLKNKDSFKLL